MKSAQFEVKNLYTAISIDCIQCPDHKTNQFVRPENPQFGLRNTISNSVFPAFVYHIRDCSSIVYRAHSRKVLAVRMCVCVCGCAFVHASAIRYPIHAFFVSDVQFSKCVCRRSITSRCCHYKSPKDTHSASRTQRKCVCIA